MARRSLILALALSVLGLGTAPDVLCAIVCSRSAEFPCCENLSSLIGLQQRTNETTGERTANCRTACTLLKVPLQISQHKDQGPSLSQAVSDRIPGPELADFNRGLDAEPFVQDTSPPPLQSLLCTFLI
jgi:hypothetical protein